ncbi:MAG TPA: hypothetical protein PKH10_11155, partial [bacterium]|nr:hypothetical protein [bacterium]
FMETSLAGHYCIGDANGGSGCADQACVDACIAAGTTAAQTQYNALITCMQSNCAAATECGQGATQQQCNDCMNSKCEDEMDTCFTTDAPVYGTMTAANTAFPFVYDGDSETDLNAQINANQTGFLQTNVFSGNYTAANKAIPPNNATYKIALAYFTASFTENGNTYPNSVTIMQQHIASDQQTLVNPLVQAWINSDTLGNGQYTIDNGDAGAVLLNDIGNNQACLLAYAFYGTFNITNSSNMTAAGGSFTTNAVGVELYHPTETPQGDISDAFTTISTCPKE